MQQATNTVFTCQETIHRYVVSVGPSPQVGPCTYTYADTRPKRNPRHGEGEIPKGGVSLTMVGGIESSRQRGQSFSGERCGGSGQRGVRHAQFGDDMTARCAPLVVGNRAIALYVLGRFPDGSRRPPVADVDQLRNGEQRVGTYIIHTWHFLEQATRHGCGG